MQRERVRSVGLSLVLPSVCALMCSVCVASQSIEQARQLFRRLVGVPLLVSDPRWDQMAAEIQSGRWKSAARIASSDSRFLSIRVRNWAAILSNKSETPFTSLNDFQALVIGVVGEDRDARDLLTADYRYEGMKSLKLPPVSLSDNKHYEELDIKGFDLKEVLVQVRPQWETAPGRGAGLLTTRGWGEAHFSGGTNRRAVEYTFREFLCRPISSWKAAGLPDLHVRRDVSRAPGGSAAVYQRDCRTCHAGMDALGGAFAYFDFVEGRLILSPGIVLHKFNQNISVFPLGKRTVDDSWVNLSTGGHNELIGWRGDLSGFGVRQFGAMVANARAFSQCMVRRVFSEVCRGVIDSSVEAALADGFEENGYRLRRLFEEVAFAELPLRER